MTGSPTFPGVPSPAGLELERGCQGRDWIALRFSATARKRTTKLLPSP
jgi:hypothetical protein